jgi:hypothetical protein
MGGSASTIGRIGSGVLTLGGSEIARNNLSNKNVINQALNIPGSILTGGAYNPLTGSGFGGASSPYVPGPFSLDPNQVSGDQSAINSLGQKQYSDTLAGIDTNATAQNQRVADIMKSSLPNIAENAQAAHLYDSTGYGQEVARQQAQLASGVASDAASQKLQALQGLQGFQTGALQRGQSLEDFINSANVAKTIGATMAPQPPSGKQNFGTVAQGVGALYPAARAIAK